MNNKVSNKIDRAWVKLYDRLDTDGLLSMEEEKVKHPLFTPKKVWTMAAAIGLVLVCIGALFYSRNDSPTLLSQNNKETSTLVTTLADGSIIYLAKDATLYYPQEFAENKREVRLEGNALFDVTGNKVRPFLIETEMAVVEVIGTSFNIKNDRKGEFELSVQRGKVTVKDKRSGKTTFVEKGQTLKVSNRQLQVLPTANKSQFESYMENIRFKDAPLKDIVRVLNLIPSDTKIVASETVGNRRLTVAFDHESPKDMAQLISIAMNLKYTKDNNTIVLSE